MNDYIATYRATFSAPDEAEAQLVAELIRERAEEELDTEVDKDEVILTQVTSMSTVVAPEELIVRFLQVRNDLIRTRYKEGYDVAGQLDQIIHALKKRLAPGEPVDYDYGKFLQIAGDILTKDASPND